MKPYFVYTILILLAFVSCEEIIFEEDLSDSFVRIIAPVDSTAVRNTSVTFTWEAVDQATEYRLQVAYPSFENAVQIVEDTTVAITSFNTALVKNNYQWRVRAQNSGSQTPYTISSFEVLEAEDFSSRNVTLVSPTDNTKTNTELIELQWEAVKDATTYRIQLLGDNDSILQEITTTETLLEITFTEGTTTWQVRAENNTQNTLYSSRQLTLDTVDPNIPTASEPINGATFTETNISFSWDREIIEGTQEFDSIYVYRDQQLSELVIKDQVTSPSELTLDSGSSYYWFLRAFDEAGNQSDSSTVLNFTIN